jgi:hypothetical protein
VGYKNVSSLIQESISSHMGVNYGVRDKVGRLQKCFLTTTIIHFNAPQILANILKYTNRNQSSTCNGSNLDGRPRRPTRPYCFFYKREYELLLQPLY